jgi:universal stress protein A
MYPARVILHPTDFSEHSEAAFQLACNLARDHGACLVVLHVAQPGVVLSDAHGARTRRPRDYREAAREKLAALHPPDPAVRVEHRIGEGEASSEILRVAEETKADLIVMGTQGRTGLQRFLIGSVAEDVLRRASCPVLTVRAAYPADVTADASHSRGATASP